MTERGLPDAVLFSVDLEPNKDGTLEGVRDAMEWFDRTVPSGTIFTTYRIADELPDLVAELSESFEIGVHVHPREFGREHDQLAELQESVQREIIAETRAEVARAVDQSPEEVVSFRAGRHSASKTTMTVLRDLGFHVDASVNVRYDDYLPSSITERSEPFEWNGLVEIPTSYAMLPVLSRCGLRRLMTGPLTATSSTIRSDSWGCHGGLAMAFILESTAVSSFYMHPYDATEYHSLKNVGLEFRTRFEKCIESIESPFITSSDVCELV